MTDATVQRITQQIRHFRELLTAQERWVRSFPLPRDDMQRESFREINFWRNVLRDAEQRLTQT